MKKWIIPFLFLSAYDSYGEFLYLGRSQEALLMGDAYTAVAEDENTLFYNPAALGRHRGLSISLLTPIIQTPDLIDINLSLDHFHFNYDKNRFSDFPREPADIATKIIGNPFFFQTGITPTIKLQHFALSFFAHSKLKIGLENYIRPEFSIDSRLDHGVIIGYALNFGNKNPRSPGWRSSYGFAAKQLYRQGLQKSFPLMGATLLEASSDNDEGIKGLKNRLGHAKGKGYGFDTGVEANYYTRNRGRLTLGASVLDIGDTKLTRTEGTRELPNQKMSVNLGTSWSQRFILFDYTLALDYSNMVDPYTPNQSKLKVGLCTRFPLLDFYWGLNGGYLSWGLGLDVLFLRIRLGFYGVEIGHDFKAKSADRFIFSVDLLRF